MNVDLCWDRRWKNVIMKDGMVQLERVKEALYHLDFLQTQIKQIYPEVSNGECPNESYTALAVLESFHRNFAATIDELH